MIYNSIKRRAENGLKFLTEHQREVYNLREQGMTFVKIAKIKGCTQSAVRQTYRRAVHCLREYERYQQIMSQNQEVFSVQLARGELRYIHTGLKRLLQEKRATAYANNSNGDGLLCAEYAIIFTIMKKIEDIIYPEEEQK